MQIPTILFFGFCRL